MKLNSMYPMAFAAAAVAMFVTLTPVSALETDAKVQPAFEASYVYKTYLKDDSIKTVTKEGAVTLSGTVADESHRGLAQDTVTNLPGVTSVDNQLKTSAEVASQNADYWIAKKIKLTLLFHRFVNAGKTTADVKDGIVTLKGEASSAAQKDLTAEYAKDIEGVKEVKNDMTVATTPEPAAQTLGEKIDDASVVAQVKMALLTHRSTTAVTTKVEARDGVVVVTGIAKNDAEKTLITKLVTDIQGVTSVKNQMTFEMIK